MRATSALRRPGAAAAVLLLALAACGHDSSMRVAIAPPAESSAASSQAASAAPGAAAGQPISSRPAAAGPSRAGADQAAAGSNRPTASSATAAGAGAASVGSSGGLPGASSGAPAAGSGSVPAAAPAAPGASSGGATGGNSGGVPVSSSAGVPGDRAGGSGGVPVGGPKALPSASRLQIPSLGVDAPIITLGVDPDGTMQVPNNGTDVGWYTFSAVPGSAGNAVISGHLDTATSKTAVFSRLKDLKLGDPMDIVENGKKMDFEVFWTKSWPDDTAPLALILGNAPSPTLTLITCSGVFDRASRNYSERLVVRAKVPGTV